MSASEPLPQRLPHPPWYRSFLPADMVEPRIVWLNVFGIGGVHLLALLALLPSFASWTGVVVALVGVLVFGLFGTNICFHRLLTHRSFQCSKRLEHFLALLGTCCLQDTPAWWVATHRQHHQHADETADPHSPLVSFLWGHVGWLLIRDSAVSRQQLYERYARDILQDQFYLSMERNLRYAWIYLWHCLLIFLASLAAGWMHMDDPREMVWFALGLTMWGTFVRTVLVWHVTWSVNSVTHIWGYRAHATGENSRNNLLIGILAAGEGWHNNHHADQRSARHGQRWWELDVTYLLIRLLERLGLAWDVQRPGQPVPLRSTGSRDDRRR